MAAAAETDTIIQRITGWAREQPTKVLYRYHDDEGKVTASISYRDMDSQTRHLAANLLAHKAGLRAGDRVLLVFLPSLDFIVAFLACLRAGLIAVPVYPPDPRKVRAYITAFSQTAKNCGAKVAITHATYLSSVSLANLRDSSLKILSLGFAKTTGMSIEEAWPDITWIDSSAMLKETAAATHIDAATAPDIAFLQYTSGSTAEPKGVMISHGNLAHNLATIVRSLEARQDTIVASWLPQYHDMGLIGSLLGVLYCGGSGSYASPLSFIKRPSLWIQLMNTYRATHIQSPNFGYQLVARKWRAAPLAGTFDLSCVRHMFNAAEPINPASMQDFVATFAPLGLSGNAMKPGYGLAEHCVYVSDAGTNVVRLDRRAFEDNRVVVTNTMRLEELWKAGATPEHSTADSVDIVSCGPVAPHAPKNPDVLVRIVNPQTALECAGNEIGEVWISSPSVAQGYWGREDLSAEVFRAHLTGGEAATSPSYMRSGDLGFIREGELYICGRAKDLIILRGKNLFPQDVEMSVEADARIRPGCSAALQGPLNPGAGTADAEDVLVVIAEVRDGAMTPSDADQLISSLRRNLTQEVGAAPAVIMLLRPHTARKTTSGKIARKWNKLAYLQMETDKDSPWAASTGNVIRLWRDTHDIVEPLATAEQDVSTGAPADEKSAQHVTAMPSYTTLEGEQLRSQLRQDLSKYLRLPAESIVDDAALVHLGADSLTLSQVSSVFSAQYGFVIKDEHMFADGLTVSWIVEHASELRTADAPAPPHQGQAEAQPGAAASGQGTAGAGDSSIAPPRSVPTVEPGVRPVQRASWFQRNCPCCLICY